jgi:hypothetical protein
VVPERSDPMTKTGRSLSVTDIRILPLCSTV